MIMEPPSPASLMRRDTRESEKLGGIEKRKREEADEEDGSVKKKKKKGPKEPNPLSVKKKTKKPVETRSEVKKVHNEESVNVLSENIVGEVTESKRRTKLVRRRKKHKKASMGTEDSMPVVTDGGEAGQNNS
jgi:U3 small nucleolar RNA-associated protein 23